VRLRLWRAEADELKIVYGDDPGWRVATPKAEGLVRTPAGESWFDPLAPEGSLWLESAPGSRAVGLRALLGLVLRADREITYLSTELAARFEEIDLLYTIGEVLGRTVRLDEAAEPIVHAVCDVVGARRASIAVHDEAAGLLRVIAARGFDAKLAPAIPIDDPASIAARVVRESRPVVGTASADAPLARARGYRGESYLSVPICFHSPGGASRCVGVLNLSDKLENASGAPHGGFSAADQKLVAAAANQIGAAIQIAGLVVKEREQQRLHDELELAHHLQVSLLPDPSVLHGDASVAVRCIPAEQLGGDFYTFNRLGLGLVAVMLGDVSSHGISAALVMAAVMAAAGIHASGADSPNQTLAALRDSLAEKLSSSDSYLTVFYGILDPIHDRLTWANAGHPHAFKVSGEGGAPPERLDATAPPLGLADSSEIGARSLPWARGRDLLCLWTDGLADAESPGGERYGEARLLEALEARRGLEPERIVAEVMTDVEAFAPQPKDDRTLLVLRI